MFSHLRTFSGE